MARAFGTAAGPTALQAPAGPRQAARAVLSSAHRPAASPRHFRWFTPALALLLGGYLFFNKPFAYLHVPGTPVFVGEIVLAIGIAEVLQVRSPWYHLLRTSPVLKALLAFMALCALRLGVDLPRYRIDAVRDSSIWYYGLFAFLVAAAVVREPTFVPRMLVWYRRVLPWFLVWAPVPVVLSQIDGFGAVSVPGTSTPINSFRPNDYAVHIGIGLAFLWLGVDRMVGARPARSREVLISVVGLLALLVAGSQSRGGFLSAVAALTITLVFLPSGRRRRIALSCACGLLVVLALAMTLNLRIEGERRDISVQQLTANLASLAGNESDEDLAGTVEWREGFWTQVLNDLLSSRAWLTGLGFGQILPERYEVDVGNTNRGPDAQPLRSVHNSHLTILARVGFPGFALWLLLWLTWTMQLFRRIRRGPGGVRDPATAGVVWLLAAVPAVLIGAYFDPSLEGPHVGVWLFSVVGLGAAITRVPRRVPLPARPAAGGAAAPARPALMPPVAVMVGVRDLAERRGWELADVALWHLLTLAVGLWVGRSVGVRELGAFSIAVAAYLLALAASRAVATDALASWHGSGDAGVWRGVVAAATGTAVVVGAVAGAGGVLASLPLPGSTGAALLGLGLTLPGLLLQDSWRSAFVAAGQGAQAFANDLLWALALLAAVAVATASGHSSVGWVVLAWGGSATLAAVAGAFQARLTPRVTWAAGWLRTHREVAARSLAGRLGLAGGALRLFWLAAAAGLAAAGALWAAELLLVPATAAVVAIVTVLAPAAADVLGRWPPPRLGRLCLWLGGLAASGAFVWGGVLLALPDTVGVRLLGSAWVPASRLLAPVAVAAAGAGLAAGAWVGQRALGAAAPGRRGQLASGVVYLVLGLGGAVLAGAAGAAWGSAAGALAGAGICWWELRRELRGAGAAGR